MSPRQPTDAAARERLAALADEAAALEAAGRSDEASVVWERHGWARNALRTPEDLLDEGLDLIATAQSLTIAAQSARPTRAA